MNVFVIFRFATMYTSLELKQQSFWPIKELISPSSCSSSTFQEKVDAFFLFSYHLVFYPQNNDRICNQFKLFVNF